MMAASLHRPRITPEQSRALELLVSSRYGIDAELLVHSHGFSSRLLAGLVHAGLVTVERRVTMPVEVVRIRITAAGRRAISAR
jgi:hypothetical protein